MTNPGPTIAEYDNLIYKLTTLETENRNYPNGRATASASPGCGTPTLTTKGAT
jgi:hypothetical protein